MREFFTFLAILLIIVLTAALVGPHFIDWSAQRAVIAARLGDAVGLPVTLAGPIHVELLPTPRLTLEGVTAGALPGVRLAADDIQIELSAGNLMHGDFDFTNLTIDGLRLEVGLDHNGIVDGPSSGFLQRQKVQFDHVAVRHGTLIIRRSEGTAGPITLADIDLDAEAGSLTGPFRGTGTIRLAGAPADFRISTGSLDNDRLPLKLFLQETASVPQTELDGGLLFPGAKGGKRDGGLAYEGRASFAGKLPGLRRASRALAWQVSGTGRADLNGATFNSIDAKIGDERPLAAKGSAAFRFGSSPEARVTLATKQIDLDQFLAGPNTPSIAPLQAVALLKPLVDGSNGDWSHGLKLMLDLDAALVTLGGDAVTDIHGIASIAPGMPVTGRFEANGPGGSHILADGALETRIGADFKGHMEASAGNVPRFAEWLAGDQPQVATAIETYVPFTSAAMAGDVNLSGVSFAGQNLTAHFDRSTVSGAFVLSRAVGQDRARVYAEMASDQLDIDALPDLRLTSDAFEDLDLAVHVVARTAKIARVGEAGVDSGRIELKLDKTGSKTTLDHVTIANLGGATLEAAGALDAKGGHLDIQLDAVKLEEFADLLRHLAPGAMTDAVSHRATALSPTKLTFHLDTDSDGSIRAARLDGVAGATKISGSVAQDDRNAGDVIATLGLDAIEAPQLLQQIGFEALPLVGLGSGRLDLSAHGRAARGFEGSLDATLAGTRLTWNGSFDVQSSAVSGQVAVHSGNLAPVLQALTFALPDPTLAPTADFSGAMTFKPGTLAFDRLAGAIDGHKVAGHLTVSPDEGPTGVGTASWQSLFVPQRVKGDLTVDQLPGTLFSELALGSARPTDANAVWSQAKFATSLANTPKTDLGLTIGRLDGGPGFDAQDVRLTLGFRPGLLSLSDVSAHWNHGTVKGQLVVRRDGTLATVSGRAMLDTIAFARPFAEGQLVAAFDFTGVGDSASALVASLSGQGKVTLADARFPGLDADALIGVVHESDAETLAMDADAVSAALATETAHGSHDVASADAPALIAAGVMTIGPLVVPDALARIEATAEINLDLLTVETTTHVQLLTAPNDWQGIPPAVDVHWKGPWSKPVRTIDAADFFNGLSARSLSINLEKLESLDFDIRERAFFNRRLKAIQAEDAREREAAEKERRQAEQETIDKASPDRKPPSSIVRPNQ